MKNTIERIPLPLAGPMLGFAAMGIMIENYSVTLKSVCGAMAVCLLILLLVVGGMPLFDSIINAMGTAGTGGYSLKNDSIAYYNSAYIDVVLTIFMLMFAVNFNLYHLVFIKK